MGSEVWVRNLTLACAVGAAAAAAAPAMAADPAPAERRTIDIAGQTFAFRWIPPGEDSIGSPASEPCRSADRERQWTARIGSGFWILETEVTQAQWKAVMEDAPSFHEACPDCPVEQVSWLDVQKFLRQVEGLTALKMRLPREAEWEYAARAGSDGPFALPCPPFTAATCKERVPCVGAQAWYAGSAEGKTHPVGRLLSNAWGLRDVHGNVAEWCEDRYGPYPEKAATDWAGPATGDTRVVRGGAFFVNAEAVRAAFRGGLRHDYRSRTVGFRPVADVLPSEPPPPPSKAK